jgi:hypothetical protein
LRSIAPTVASESVTASTLERIPIDLCQRSSLQGFQSCQIISGIDIAGVDPQRGFDCAVEESRKLPPDALKKRTLQHGFPHRFTRSTINYSTFERFSLLLPRVFCQSRSYAIVSRNFSHRARDFLWLE